MANCELQIAHAMRAAYKAIKPWHPETNPSGPTGTRVQREEQKFLIAWRVGKAKEAELAR